MLLFVVRCLFFGDADHKQRITNNKQQVTMDHFERLGLPRRFSLDMATLEREYLSRSRALHPDYHQLSGSIEQAASVEMTAALNEAYVTLKDPFRRAEYLHKLEGGPTASEQKDMPAEFLEEMLELRMEIAGLTPESPAAIAMEKQLRERRDEMLQQVGTILESLTPDNRTAQLAAARRKLNAAKYVQNLLRDLRAL
jgi:molecular chaperone HscB